MSIDGVEQTKSYRSGLRTKKQADQPFLQGIDAAYGGSLTRPEVLEKMIEHNTASGIIGDLVDYLGILAAFIKCSHKSCQSSMLPSPYKTREEHHALLFVWIFGVVTQHNHELGWRKAPWKGEHAMASMISDRIKTRHSHVINTITELLCTNCYAEVRVRSFRTTLFRPSTLPDSRHEAPGNEFWPCLDSTNNAERACKLLIPNLG